MPAYQRNIVFALIAILAYCKSAAAEDAIFTFIDKAFTVKIINSKSAGHQSATVNISKSFHTKSSVFSVPNPERIVIDLEGVSLKKNKDSLVEGSEIIKAVRFGSHKDKARIVIDLKQDKALPYQTTESPGVLSLTIQSSAAEKEQKDAVIKKAVPLEKKPEEAEEEILKIEPTNTALPKTTKEIKPTNTPTSKPSVTISTIKPKPTALEEEIIIPAEDETDLKIEELIQKKPASTPTKIIVKTAEPAATPTALPTATALPENTAVIPEKVTESEQSNKILISDNTKTPELPQTQAMRAIKFGYTESLKSTPVIKIDLVNKSEFELQKTDEKTYTLTVKNCREFKPELKFVNFPPHDFVGFTYVQADANKFDIDVKIGVERNKRITATPHENEIWVTVLEDDKPEIKPNLMKKPMGATQRSPVLK